MTNYLEFFFFFFLKDEVDSAREAYDAFFSYYPYCYGYWKKYADLEKRHNDLTKAVEVRKVKICIKLTVW